MWYANDGGTGLGWFILCWHDRSLQALISHGILSFYGAPPRITTWLPVWGLSNLIRHVVNTLDEGSARCRDLYRQRTTQRITNHLCPERIRTHDSSNHAARTNALDRAATGTVEYYLIPAKISYHWHLNSHSLLQDINTPKAMTEEILIPEHLNTARSLENSNYAQRMILLTRYH